jgi:hypothetical protein
MYPAASRKKSQAKAVIARTMSAAMRQPWYGALGRHARANTSSGEITAIKRKI